MKCLTKRAIKRTVCVLAALVVIISSNWFTNVYAADGYLLLDLPNVTITMESQPTSHAVRHSPWILDFASFFAHDEEATPADFPYDIIPYFPIGTTMRIQIHALPPTQTVEWGHLSILPYAGDLGEVFIDDLLFRQIDSGQGIAEEITLTFETTGFTSGYYTIWLDHVEYGFNFIVFYIYDGDIATTPNLSTASNWAHEGITSAFNLGLIPQSLQNNFTANTTRAEFAALAVDLYENVRGGEITGRMQFNDTNDINVQKMGYLGVVTGVGGGNFAPNSGLTREQAAVMLSRLANVIGQPLPPSAPTFVDNASISSWAIDAVGQMQATGIMGGVGNNRFAPQGDYTREQSIITILRLLDTLN